MMNLLFLVNIKLEKINTFCSDSVYPLTVVQKLYTNTFKFNS